MATAWVSVNFKITAPPAGLWGPGVNPLLLVDFANIKTSFMLPNRRRFKIHHLWCIIILPSSGGCFYLRKLLVGKLSSFLFICAVFPVFHFLIPPLSFWTDLAAYSPLSIHPQCVLLPEGIPALLFFSFGAIPHSTSFLV